MKKLKKEHGKPIGKPLSSRLEGYPKDIFVVIHRDILEGLDYVCQPEQAKTRNMPKWFCWKCKRYVLPDGNKHLNKIC